ncbi:MAG: hypothetical protein GKR95_23985 [Gammaproteobacteria bacterium]|nr:hypothetical protein [Gammaproteobacteria bacterium]
MQHKVVGYSLIETMVGMTIGLLVMSGIMSVFGPALETYRQIDAISQVQEMERTAFSIFSKAMESAGYIGCNSSLETKLNHHTKVFPASEDNWSAMHYEYPFRIFPSAQNMTDILGQSRQKRRPLDTDNITLVGDVLFISGVFPSPITLLNHRIDSQDIEVLGNQTQILEAGTLVTLNDCHRAATFQIGEPQYDRTTRTTWLHYGNSTTNNCTAMDDDGRDTDLVMLGVKVGSQAGCDSEQSRSQFLAYRFPAGSQVSVKSGAYYYLAYPSGRENPSPSLYRVYVDEDGFPGLASEMISGVENFRPLYGIRQTSDGNISYLTATQLSEEQDIDGDGEMETFNNIRSIRIHLLFRSESSKGKKTGSGYQIYDFPNEDGLIVHCDGYATDRTACPFFIDKDSVEQSRYRRPLTLSFYLRNTNP